MWGWWDPSRSCDHHLPPFRSATPSLPSPLPLSSRTPVLMERLVWLQLYSLRQAARAVENFLDVTHFPFVHQGLLGDPAYPEVNDYEVETTPEGVTAQDITVWQPDPDGSGKGARVTYTYKVVRALTAYFVKSSAGPRFAMYFTITPVAERSSIAWTYVAKDYEDLSDDQVRQFEDMITLQDIPIV